MTSSNARLRETGGPAGKFCSDPDLGTRSAHKHRLASSCSLTAFHKVLDCGRFHIGVEIKTGSRHFRRVGRDRILPGFSEDSVTPPFNRVR
jgi:hypothetical protein